AFAYDIRGAELVEVWTGRAQLTGAVINQFDPASGVAWGMYYLTGFIYYIFGRNIFAAQSFCAVIGAATAPMVFFCARKIFSNVNVAKFAAIGIAIFPSFVIWSGQLLKDGLIIFLLVTAMTMVLQLQSRFSYPAVGVLIVSLFGILSLRFYIFYMVVVAVVGSFLVGMSSTKRSILRSTVILIAVGIGLAYLGVGRNVSVELTTFGNLDRVQGSRSDLVRAADSGFGEDLDVSTAEGALSAIPLGFAYLMFAPFPWQATNLRQAITIPEILVWWSMIPFLVIGLKYAIKHRLRNAFPILIFSLMLTIAYSIFQGNVGTAYRQRTQIQVFLFILVGVGWTVFKEERENKRIMRAAAQRRVESQLRANAVRRETV
ncbi:MAG: glycosyltransferase family 39 protein, partial [Pyrinomonadaceae bacterium]